MSSLSISCVGCQVIDNVYPRFIVRYQRIDSNARAGGEASMGGIKCDRSGIGRVFIRPQ